MKIHAREVGQGPALILLHGFAGNVAHWDPLLERLQKKFTCVVLNYSHFYLSREALSFAEQVQEVGRWIQYHYPNQRVHMCGISFGAALVWGVALKFPELVERTIFINPMPPQPARFFAMTSMRMFFTVPVFRKSILFYLHTPIGKKFLSKCAQLFRLRTQDNAERLTQLTGKKRLFIGHLFNNFAWILKNENWVKWHYKLESWVHNSLLIYDDMDPLFQAAAYEHFQDLLSCEETFVMRGTGHISILFEGEALALRIEAFLLNDPNQMPIAG